MDARTLVSIREDRPLSAEERSMLQWLLSHAEERGRSFLPQIDAARVVSRCGCGCASIDLSINGREPSPGAGLERISDDYLWTAENGALCGISAYAKDGHLAGLETWSVNGQETPSSLPRASELRTYEQLGSEQ